MDFAVSNSYRCGVAGQGLWTVTMHRRVLALIAPDWIHRCASSGGCRYLRGAAHPLRTRLGVLFIVAFFLILTVVITAVRALAYDATVIQLSLLPALALGHLAEEREAHDFFGLLRVGTLDLGRQPSFRMSGGKTNKGFEGTRGQWRSLEENKRVEGRKIKG